MLIATTAASASFGVAKVLACFVSSSGASNQRGSSSVALQSGGAQVVLAQDEADPPLGLHPICCGDPA